MLSLICPELGVTPLVDPGTDVEDEWPVNGVVPLSAQADVDIELCQVFQDVGALPEMVTPVGDPEGGGGGLWLFLRGILCPRFRIRQW